MSSEFDFNERQNILVPTDKINFAGSPFVLASNDLIAIASQEMIGQQLPRVALLPIGRLRICLSG
jgi:hypothetical protein